MSATRPPPRRERPVATRTGPLGSRHPASLTCVTDLDARRFLTLVSTALKMKDDRRLDLRTRSVKRADIALLFEGDCALTRCAFEVAAMEIGAQTSYVGGPGTHGLGDDESVADAARVLGRMYDAIVFRGAEQGGAEQGGAKQGVAETLARYAGVPVWNALSDQWHPTQMLGDVMTMIEHHPGPMGDLTVGYVGDGRGPVARSLLVTAGLLGFRIRMAAPQALYPPAAVVDLARTLAGASGGDVCLTDDPVSAVRGADFVYTHRWIGPGEPETSWASRIELLRPYRVTTDLIAESGRATTKFLHDLPAVHDTSSRLGRRLAERFGLGDGAEVAGAVFESPASLVFEQAENQLHSIKALMWHAFKPA